MAEGTGRLEAFSDGVFAIAITLLILEIRVPHSGAEGGLWAGLAALWPSYLAFVLSFFVILIMWVNHHELMRLVRAVGYPFLFANGFVLLTVTFVPFPTAVLAEHLATAEASAAVTFYCGTFVVNSLAWGLLFWAIERGRLFRADVDAGTIGRIRRAYIGGAAGLCRRDAGSVGATGAGACAQCIPLAAVGPSLLSHKGRGAQTVRSIFVVVGSYAVMAVLVVVTTAVAVRVLLQASVSRRQPDVRRGRGTTRRFAARAFAVRHLRPRRVGSYAAAERFLCVDGRCKVEATPCRIAAYGSDS